MYIPLGCPCREAVFISVLCILSISKCFRNRLQTSKRHEWEGGSKGIH